MIKKDSKQIFKGCKKSPTRQIPMLWDGSWPDLQSPSTSIWLWGCKPLVWTIVWRVKFDQDAEETAPCLAYIRRWCQCFHRTRRKGLLCISKHRRFRFQECFLARLLLWKPFSYSLSDQRGYQLILYYLLLAITTVKLLAAATIIQK